MTPLFIATKRFDPSDGERWKNYFQWAKIPALAETVTLDCSLCPRLVTEFNTEDWEHIVKEDFRLNYFYHLDYLLGRVKHLARRNILGLYRNVETEITIPPAPKDFAFLGHDLIEEQTQISALTNCGDFQKAFSNDELNSYGLILSFERVSEIRRLLVEQYPKESHANCELYAIWRFNEANPTPTSS